MPKDPRDRNIRGENKQDYDTKDNEGKLMKQKMFKNKGFHVCNRLIEKLDRGFDIEQIKKDSSEAFLDDHPRGF